MAWQPHLTVACIIENNGKFLFVEEQSHGKLVLNQPAGHLEPNESLEQAALRETLEESGCQVKLEGIVGYYTYIAPENQESYFRMCYSASLISQDPDHPLDKGIERALWLSKEELENQLDRLRSPLVILCLQDYLDGKLFPLNLVHELGNSNN